ncbi:hypothetical protein SNOG_10353 [Parastagonospora nodorum SN15]|uniref:Secreted protein n=1 Tax=Phaeosphaeria nodorum (strain SN15 / ATCC MYA-4574 / FGSC 10173) TaxID=321614 RepID=Q0UD11_PHANO|nr:hypothetical protein SNOG_10353 [Parastagonospora nodorum SN15]EAT82688.1 hypothetical protein SNOG_10353 [Parastagonospora nodorum SN15]
MVSLARAWLLTVLGAGGRDCRSFVGAVVHNVKVWGSRFNIERRIFGWDVKRVVRATSSFTATGLPSPTPDQRNKLFEHSILVSGIAKYSTLTVPAICYHSDASMLRPPKSSSHIERQVRGAHGA